MFRVFEVFNSDGKRFLMHESTDRFDCEVYVYQHQYDHGALLNGKSKLIIEEA